MNFKRIGRVLVCLLLVFCLIVNISPIRAQAFAVSGTMIGVTATDVVAGILIGLGVMPGTNHSDFDNIVNSAVDFLTDAGSVANGLMNVWFLSNANYKYAYDSSDIDMLRSWLSGEGEVLSFSSFASQFPDIPSDVWAVAQSYSHYAVCLNRWGNYVVMCGDGSYSIDSYCFVSEVTGQFKCDHIYLRASASGQSWYSETSEWGTHVSTGYQDLLEPGWYDVDPMTLVQYGISGAGDSAQVTTDKDLILGEIFPGDIALAEGYTTWAGNATTIPASDSEREVTVYPGGLAQTYNDTKGLTQTDVWEGVSTYEDTNNDVSDPDNSTDPSGSTMADITVTAFLGKLLADLTKMFFGTGTKTLTELFGSTWTEMRALGQSVTQGLTEIKTEFLTGCQNITRGLTDLKTEFLAGLHSLSDTIVQVCDAIVTSLLDGLKSLFIPSDNYLDYEVEKLCNDYPLANSFIDTGYTLRDFFLGLSGSPPVIYIHLDDAEGSYKWGNTVAILDMNWYARYKPTVDTLLSSLMWLFFIWRLLVHAPNIISGIAGDVEVFNSAPSGGYFTRDSEYASSRNVYERLSSGKHENRRKKR